MREDVIVEVKREVHSDDEGDEIDPSTIPQTSTSSNGITAEISTSSEELNLENTSEPSAVHNWPCAMCGRLFHQQQEVLEHVKNEHANQIMNYMIGQMDDGLRAKIAAIRQQNQLLSMLQNGQAAAAGLLQMPGAAAALFQLMGVNPGVPKAADVPLIPTFPIPTQATPRMEKASSPYERRGSFPGRPRHPVWSLFLRIDKFDAECTICKSRVRSACPTNLCRHLNNNHCELASQLFVKWKKQKEDLGGSFPPLEPRGNRHKSSSTSSTSSSASIGSSPTTAAAAMPIPLPATAAMPAAAASAAPPTPLIPGFPHLDLVIQQQQLLLKQREQASALAPDVLKAIDAQLAINSRIIAEAQKVLEAGISSAGQSEKIPSTESTSNGVIQFGAASGGEEGQSTSAGVRDDESPIDIESISPDLDALFAEKRRESEGEEAASAAAASRPHSAPPTCCNDEEDPAASSRSAARPSSAPPSMIALMDGGNGTYEMYAYQELPPQLQPEVLLQQQLQGETAAALRQPATLENWFATAYAQQVPLEAAAVMNAGAYGTLASSTDAASLAAAAVAETANFPTDIKNVPLFTEEQQQLFAASSSTSTEIDHQQQLQLFQAAVKQEQASMDESGGDESSQRGSIFHTVPATTSSGLCMNQLVAGQPPAKRGRPTENPCWEYFDRLDDTLVKCRTCEKVVKSACATNMTKHLERHHPEEYQILLQKIKFSRQFKPNTVPTVPGGSSSASSSTGTSSNPQFMSNTMALNHLAHQPQHHLLQPMATDLSQQISHHLPLSPDPSPANCFISSTPHHIIKSEFQDHSMIRPEMLLIPTSDGIIPNLDPNSYHVPSDFYQTMQFDNSALFDNASQWQQRHFAPVASTGYDQWMNAADQSGAAMLMPDDWSQSAAAAAAAAAAQQQAQLDQLQLQQNSVIQSVVNGATTSTDVLDAAALAAAAAVAASDASSTSSTSSSSCGATAASAGNLVGLMRQHESKPYMKRNRKTEHPVWEFFKRTADGNAQCSICSGIVKSPCSSNFMRHLMRHHSTEYNSVYTKWSQKRGPTIKSTSASF